jgi:hypothetical protein
MNVSYMTCGDVVLQANNSRRYSGNNGLARNAYLSIMPNVGGDAGYQIFS